MSVTPMGVYYSSIGAIKHYSHENGEVYMTHGGEFYSVTVIKQTSSYSEEYKTRGRLDALAADEFFDVACQYLRNEIQWRDPVRKFSCKFNPNTSRGCTDNNCPHALGGAAYRELFGASCLYRKTRSR